MSVLSDRKDAFSKQRSDTSIQRKSKTDMARIQKKKLLSEPFVKIMDRKYEVDEDGMSDCIKYVKTKIKEAKETVWTDLVSVNNISDETKEKILGSYKKINVKPYKDEKDVILEDVEDE